MKLKFGTRKEIPARRHSLVIQERVYNNLSDLMRAKTQMDRIWHEKGLAHFNLFFHHYTDDGKPVLYFCRCFLPEELAKVGLTPKDLNYSEFTYNWRINGR